MFEDPNNFENIINSLIPFFAEESINHDSMMVIKFDPEKGFTALESAESVEDVQDKLMENGFIQTCVLDIFDNLDDINFNNGYPDQFDPEHPIVFFNNGNRDSNIVHVFYKESLMTIKIENSELVVLETSAVNLRSTETEELIDTLANFEARKILGSKMKPSGPENNPSIDGTAENFSILKRHIPTGLLNKYSTVILTDDYGMYMDMINEMGIMCRIFSDEKLVLKDQPLSLDYKIPENCLITILCPLLYPENQIMYGLLTFDGTRSHIFHNRTKLLSSEKGSNFETLRDVIQFSTYELYKKSKERSWDLDDRSRDNYKKAYEHNLISDKFSENKMIKEVYETDVGYVSDVEFVPPFEWN